MVNFIIYIYCFFYLQISMDDSHLVTVADALQNLLHAVTEKINKSGKGNT